MNVNRPHNMSDLEIRTERNEVAITISLELDVMTAEVL